MQIVAPAGSIDGLRACINGGADAVYLGMPDFGARAKARNFTREEFARAVEYAHLFGVKVFVTLNTLIKDGEMSAAVDHARYAFCCGADAAIVQDLRFIRRLKDELPEFPLHGSTQMGIHNALGAQTLLDMGIKRAVLSRETLPVDIERIKKTGIEIEYFVQGALCVCFSGNCYFSSLASSYSGNRGKCMQLCRKPYYFGGKLGYHLSAKDLCLYGDLRTLERLGVDAVKIEGRMRSPEYAYTAAQVYKTRPSPDVAVKRLKSVFNRGSYCSGYLHDGAQFDVIYPYSQGNIGISVGKIDRVQANKLFVNGLSPHVGDSFKVMRGKTEVCGAAVRNGAITCESGGARVGDELRRTSDGALADSCAKMPKLLDVDIDVKVSEGQRAVVTARCGAAECTVTSRQVSERASSCAVTERDIVRAFEKVADHPFLPHITATVGGSPFVPVSALNELRRQAYAQLSDGIIKLNSPEREILLPFALEYNKFDEHGVVLAVESADDIDAEIMAKVDHLVLDPSDYNSFDIPKTDKPILLNLPVTARGDDMTVLQKAVARDGIFGAVSNNYYALKLTDKPILLGIGHNLIGKCELPHVRSVEADGQTGGFTYVFGHAPLMTLCHCPYGKCVHCGGRDELKDENGRVFAMRRYKTAHCYWQLLNCVPHYIPQARGDIFIDGKGVDKRTLLAVLNGDYRGKFTRGNINKGLK